MTYILRPALYRYITAAIFVLRVYATFGQHAGQTPYIELAFNKTSSIVFASPITAVDRGSRDVLAQKAKGVSNVLQLKAARTNFKETNLTVITADGMLHHFFVRYTETPAMMTLDRRAAAPENSDPASLIFEGDVNETSLQRDAEYILTHPPRSSLRASARNKMKLSLERIYIHDNVMYYHVRISNASHIPFHTDMLRFFIRDRQQIKRTASQEVGEAPLYIAGSSDVVGAHQAIDVVYALPKFTIPDAKRLVIELLERKGGRHLRLQIHNKTIMKAVPLP
jgi:conjugative transposon TraN protein